MKKISTISFVAAFVIVSIILIAYARGFRIDLSKKSITSTGLLVATSTPDGASVFLNDHLTTATNNTINLTPKDYVVKIVKDGYLPWTKSLKIQAEIVTKTDALLFPAAPSLKPLTLSGALNPSLSPDGARIVYSLPLVNNNNSQNNPDSPLNQSGLWVLNLSTRPLSFTRDAQRIVKSTAALDFSKARIVWSPDSKQIAAIFNIQKTDNSKQITENIIYGVDTTNVDSAYLLDANNLNSQPQDITATLSITLQTWQAQKESKYQDQLLSLPKPFLKIATASASLLQFSPDETKILYVATESATIPEIIKPPLIGSDSQPEERNIKPDYVYVYDVKEDKNFKIESVNSKPASVKTAAGWQAENLDVQKANPFTIDSLMWYPDSKHLVKIGKDAISVMEYDGTNNVTVFSGPFEDSFVFPWPDGSKLVILTTLNKSAGEIPNLYAVGLN